MLPNFEPSKENFFANKMIILWKMYSLRFNISNNIKLSNILDMTYQNFIVFSLQKI